MLLLVGIPETNTAVYQMKPFSFWETIDQDIRSALEVEIYINNVLQENDTQFITPIQQIFDTFTSKYRNIFQVNIASILQKHFSNNSIFPATLNQFVNESNSVDEFKINVFSYLPQGGYLTKQVLPYESNTFKFFNMLIASDEMNQDYLNPINRKFLTNRPKTRTIGVNQNEYLSIYSYDDMRYLITTYDQNGGFIASGLIQALDTINTALPTSVQDEKIHTINLNPTTLANANWIVGSPSNFRDSSVSYFTVQVLDPNNGDNFSEMRTYYIDYYPCPIYELHFMNSFGQLDSFAVAVNRDDRYRVSAGEFENNDVVRKLYNKVDLIFTAHAQNLLPEETTWLKELLSSALVRLNEEGTWVDVIIQDSTQTLDETYQSDREVLFNVIKGQSEYSHRN